MEANARFIWQQAVEDYSDHLVELADETLSEEMMQKLRDKRTDMRSAQFSNLLAVTQEAGGGLVVLNWVRYQMGRRDTSKQWKETGLGDAISNDIGKIRQQAKDIIKQAFNDDPPRGQRRQTELMLLSQYAGYLRRWFIAKGGRE